MNETIAETVEQVINLTLGKTDMVVFALLLALSLGVGIYYAWCGKMSDTTDEYLLAERKLKILPAAISILSRFLSPNKLTKHEDKKQFISSSSKISATTVMLLPVEVYSNGIQYIMTIGGMTLAVLLMIYIVAPVYYSTINRSCYEYLELRFDKKTRQVATISFLATVYLLMPVVLFIPSLAFSQVTGINVHAINSMVCSICVVYTMLGGVKAVVWTDFFQGLIMIGSAFAIAWTGVQKVGGISEVFTRANNGGRLEMFNLSMNVMERVTFWNTLLGGMCVWFSFLAINQSCVQRIIAMPSLNHAKKTLWTFLVGFFIITGLCCFNGIVMYAKYHACDPIASKQVKKADKVMPFFVQDILGHIPGMAGLFISCVFSAGLSTLSANIHSMSGVVYFDYIRPFVNHTERKANLIMKGLVLFTGFYCILAGFIVEMFPSLLQLNITVSSIAQGTMVGVFMLGMLYPRANSLAAFVSSLISLSVMSWIIVGSQVQQLRGKVVGKLLPIRTDGCTVGNVTALTDHFVSMVTTQSTPINPEPEAFSIYKVSFMWYALIGALIVWLVGIPLSFIIGKNELAKLDHNLITPFARFMIPKEYRREPVSQSELSFRTLDVKLNEK